MSSRPPRPPPAHSEAPHPRDSVCPGPAAPRLPPRPLSTEQAPLLQTRVGEPFQPGTHPHTGRTASVASPPQRGRGCGQRGRTAGLCSACESRREQRVSGPRPGGRPTSSLWLASTRPAGQPAGTASQQPAPHQRPGSWPVSARRPRGTQGPAGSARGRDSACGGRGQGRPGSVREARPAEGRLGRGCGALGAPSGPLLPVACAPETRRRRKLWRLRGAALCGPPAGRPPPLLGPERSQRPAGSERSAPWSRATTSACCPWARPLGSPPAPQTLRLLSPHGLTLTSDPSHRLVPGTDPSATLPRPGGSTLQ